MACRTPRPARGGGTMTVGETAPSPRPEHLAAGDPVRGLYGRERELAVLDDLAGQSGGGAGGALVVRGEAGIGKSALLAAVIAQARDHGTRGLSTTGGQSEARLPFAGLHQLLRPILQLAEALPPPQRAALLAAFGMAEEVAPELFLIGLAALELIADTSASSAVLLIADDAQWLDQPSCSVLSFVARRLAAEPAVMLIAVRDGHPSPFDDAGLAGLRVAGLTEAAAGMLLDAHAPGLEPVRRERRLAEAAGNPLGLVELAAALRAEHRRARRPAAGVQGGETGRRVWHGAAAAVGLDEQVAAELQEAAGRAGRRGAAAVAIAALERAAQLSEDPVIRGSRLLHAAELAFDLGSPGLGPQLLQAAEPLELPAEERPCLSYLPALFSGTDWSGAATIGSIVERAERRM